MRTLLAALALAAVPAAASAQSHAGSLRLSGGTGFTASSTGYSVKGASGELKFKTQSAGTEGAYLFTPYLGVGATIQYAKTTVSASGIDDSSQEAWTAGPLLALEYPMDRAVLRANVGWTWAHSTLAPGIPTLKSSGWAASGGVGFLVAPWVSLDLGVSYSSLGAKLEGVDTTMKTFAASVGFSVYLGGAGGGHAVGGAEAPSGTRTTGAGNPSPW